MIEHLTDEDRMVCAVAIGEIADRTFDRECERLGIRKDTALPAPLLIIALHEARIKGQKVAA